MSCRELERLLAAAVSADEIAAHRAGCRTCARAASDIEETERLTAALTPPVWSASLREALLTIPATTVSCEDAAAFIAVAVDSDPGESRLSPADRSRLDFHLRRCDGCREALDTLAGVPELVDPRPAPWFPARLAASRPVKRRSGWRGLLDPRAAIGFAYGSALVVMLAGFNPADLARKAGANLRTETRTASTKATVASGSLADRVGAFQDHVNRKFAVLRGRAGGYGRAILSNAVSLVMKSSEPPPAPSRPRNGQDRVMPKNPTGTQTWASLRAGTAPCPSTRPASQRMEFKTMDENTPHTPPPPPGPAVAPPPAYSAAPPPPPYAAPAMPPAYLPYPAETKSPALAGFLSMFPGLGHLYLGLYQRGIFFGLAFVLCISASAHGRGEFFGPLIAFVWFFGVIDAVRQAHAINRGFVAEGGFAPSAAPARRANGTASLTWGVILVGIGALWLIDRYVDVDWSFLDRWGAPAAFILLGLVLIISHVRKKRVENESGVGMPPKTP